MRKTLVRLVVSCPVILAPWSSVVAAATSPPHVMIVLMENHSYKEVIGNAQMPYINALAAANAVISTTDLSHPSEPNYLGLVSGSIQDNPQDVTPQDKT